MNSIVLRAAFICAASLLCALSSRESRAAQIESPFTYATRYNVAGQMTGTISPDPDGSGSLRLLATRYTYNSLGQLTKIEVGELTSWANEDVLPTAWGGYGFSGTSIFSTTEFTYDSYGRKIKELVRGLDTTPEALVQYSYDSESFVRCKAVRMDKARFLLTQPDPCVPDQVGSQGPDRVFRYTNDIYGQVWKEERALGTPIEQIYSQTTYAMHSPTSYVDANGNRTELKYNDGYGRVNEIWYPSATTPGVANSGDKSAYVYDANGNVTSETKRNSTTITYTIDGLNRATKKDLSDNSKGDDVEYDYDARGLRLYARFVNSPSIGTVNVYDGFARLKNATSATAVGTAIESRMIEYLYDANGNRTKVRHPGNKNFNYGFDGLNRVVCVSEGGNCGSSDTNKLVVVNYRSDGKRGSLSRPGGATTNYTYDNAGRLWTFNQDFAGTADDMTNTFYYNASGQAIQLTYGNSAFAPAGNSNRTGAYVVNGLNQYTSNAGASIGYDANGNLTSDSPSTFTYDMENRLTGMSSPAGALKYDPLGRLSEYTAPLAAAPIQFLYDGDALVAEYAVSGNTSTVVKRYAHGAGVDEPWVQYNGMYVNVGVRRFLHADHQGSIIAQSNSSGTILGGKVNYDAFGIPSGLSDRFGYTGQTWLSELGLNYYKARMYHPRLGRFLQTDPTGYQDDMNMYAYVGNDPLNRADPDGRVGIPGFLYGFAADVIIQRTIEGKSWSEVDYGESFVSGVAGAIIPGMGNALKTAFSGGKVVINSAKAASTVASQSARTANRAAKIAQRVAANEAKAKAAAHEVADGFGAAAVNQMAQAALDPVVPPLVPADQTTTPSSDTPKSTSAPAPAPSPVVNVPAPDPCGSRNTSGCGR